MEQAPHLSVIERPHCVYARYFHRCAIARASGIVVGIHPFLFMNAFGKDKVRGSVVEHVLVEPSACGGMNTFKSSKYFAMIVSGNSLLSEL